MKLAQLKRLIEEMDYVEVDGVLHEGYHICLDDTEINRDESRHYEPYLELRLDSGDAAVAHSFTVQELLDSLVNGSTKGPTSLIVGDHELVFYKRVRVDLNAIIPSE